MEQFHNFGVSTLVSAIDDEATTLQVVSATNFPTQGDFRIRIDGELMLVTSVSLTEFTVERAIEGTSATNHASGSYVRHVLTAGSLIAAVLDGALQSGELEEALETILENYVTTEPESSARNVIQSENATTTPLVVKGHASQSVNYFDVQNSAGTSLVNLDANSQLNLAGPLSIAGGNVYVHQIGDINSSTGQLRFAANGGPIIARDRLQVGTTGEISAAAVPLTVKGASAQSANLTEWRDSSNNVLGYMSSGGELTVTGLNYIRAGDFLFNSGELRKDGYARVTGRNFQFLSGQTTDVPLISKGLESQSANLQEWQNNSGTALANVTSSGGFVAATINANDLTASRALTSGASGKIQSSSVTSTELGYLSGVTSAIQTQLNGKQATITGAVSNVVFANLTGERAMVTDAGGKVNVSGISSTELNYLSGVTSNIQTQINAKSSSGVNGVVQLANGSGGFTSDGGLFYSANDLNNVVDTGSSSRAGYAFYHSLTGLKSRLEGVNDNFDGQQLNFSIVTPSASSYGSAETPVMVMDTGMDCEFDSIVGPPVIRNLVPVAFSGNIEPHESQIKPGEVVIWLEITGATPELKFKAIHEDGNLYEKVIPIDSLSGGSTTCGHGCNAFYL